MKGGQATRRERFLPYRYEPFGLQVSIARCVADGGRSVGEVDAERHLVDLVTLEARSVEIDVHVEVTAELLVRVFPPGEREPAPADLVLAVRGGRTHLRRGTVVGRDGIHPGRYQSRVTLARDDVLGSVELVPFLIRTRAGDSGTEGFASLPGTRVASSRPWEVRFDLLRKGSGNYLEIRWDSFGQRPETFPSSAVLFHLECDGEEPILWLNTDHPRVHAVCTSQANTGAKARLRELIFDYVSHPVWTRLFLAAARAVVRAGEDDDPPFAWQEGVLAQLLPRLYENEIDHESRLAALRRDLQAGDEGLVLERLDTALQLRFDTASHMERLAEELE